MFVSQIKSFRYDWKSACYKFLCPINGSSQTASTVIALKSQKLCDANFEIIAVPLRDKFNQLQNKLLRATLTLHIGENSRRKINETSETDLDS